MERFFNTAGPCRSDLHYMLPPERRLPDVRRLIDRQQYFAVYAPRQVGKTTSFLAVAEALNASGEVAALLTSLEVGQTLSGDVEASMSAILATLESRAGALPEDRRPPPADPEQPARTRLYDLLHRWTEMCPVPVVLFLEEIDALRDEALISVLRQLRAGYLARPHGFPISIALIGLRDVRDYRVEDDGSHLGTSSSFNIKVESMRIRDFTRAEVAELLTQHTEATGQVWLDTALHRAFELTRGQPWLVNALAAEITDRLVTDRSHPIGPSEVDGAREILIQRRDTHLDSLIERLRESRVQGVIEPLLAGGLIDPGLDADDLRYTMDLGLVAEGPRGMLEIANPIYHEVIPRALAWVSQSSLPTDGRSFVSEDGRLLLDRLLEDFSRFWREHAESYLKKQPYSEAAAQLIFMAYLQKVVNGGGFVDREYGVGAGRIDLHIRWRRAGEIDRFALELKVWRTGAPDPRPRGLDQLSDYLDRLGLDEGTLIVFDARSEGRSQPGEEESVVRDHRGKRINVLML